MKRNEKEISRQNLILGRKMEEIFTRKKSYYGELEIEKDSSRNNSQLKLMIQNGNGKNINTNSGLSQNEYPISSELSNFISKSPQCFLKKDNLQNKDPDINQFEKKQKYKNIQNKMFPSKQSTSSESSQNQKQKMQLIGENIKYQFQQQNNQQKFLLNHTETESNSKDLNIYNGKNIFMHKKMSETQRNHISKKQLKVKKAINNFPSLTPNDNQKFKNMQIEQFDQQQASRIYAHQNPSSNQSNKEIIHKQDLSNDKMMHTTEAFLQRSIEGVNQNTIGSQNKNENLFAHGNLNWNYLDKDESYQQFALKNKTNLSFFTATTAANQKIDFDLLSRLNLQCKNQQGLRDRSDNYNNQNISEIKSTKNLYNTTIFHNKHKSLNYDYRKKESKRIEDENFKFYLLMMNLKPSSELQVKNLSKRFKKQQKLKKTIKQTQYINRTEIMVKHTLKKREQLFNNLPHVDCKHYSNLQGRNEDRIYQQVQGGSKEIIDNYQFIKSNRIRNHTFLTKGSDQRLMINLDDTKYRKQKTLKSDFSHSDTVRSRSQIDKTLQQNKNIFTLISNRQLISPQKLALRIFETKIGKNSVKNKKEDQADFSIQQLQKYEQFSKSGINKNRGLNQQNDEEAMMKVKKIFDLNPHKEYFRQLTTLEIPSLYQRKEYPILKDTFDSKILDNEQLFGQIVMSAEQMRQLQQAISRKKYYGNLMGIQNARTPQNVQNVGTKQANNESQNNLSFELARKNTVKNSPKETLKGNKVPNINRKTSEQKFCLKTQKANQSPKIDSQTKIKKNQTQKTSLSPKIDILIERKKKLIILPQQKVEIKKTLKIKPQQQYKAPINWEQDNLNAGEIISITASPPNFKKEISMDNSIKFKANKSSEKFFQDRTQEEKQAQIKIQQNLKKQEITKMIESSEEEYESDENADFVDNGVVRKGKNAETYFKELEEERSQQTPKGTQNQNADGGSVFNQTGNRFLEMKSSIITNKNSTFQKNKVQNAQSLILNPIQPQITGDIVKIQQNEQQMDSEQKLKNELNQKMSSIKKFTTNTTNNKNNSFKILCSTKPFSSKNINNNINIQKVQSHIKIQQKNYNDQENIGPKVLGKNDSGSPIVPFEVIQATGSNAYIFASALKHRESSSRYNLYEENEQVQLSEDDIYSESEDQQLSSIDTEKKQAVQFSSLKRQSQKSLLLVNQQQANSLSPDMVQEISQEYERSFINNTGEASPNSQKYQKQLTQRKAFMIDDS